MLWVKVRIVIIAAELSMSRELISGIRDLKRVTSISNAWVVCTTHANPLF